MMDFWNNLPAFTQDLVLALAMILPVLIIGFILIRGFAPFPLARALLRRYIGTNIAYVALIAVAVGLGGALIAQERGLRDASARAADPFDIVITAPGDELTALMTTVYLRIAAVPLLDGHVFNEVAQARGVKLAAPLAFGDSYKSHPIVGTIASFVTELTDKPLTGRLWQAEGEAVIGAAVDLAIGDTFEPAHGVGHAAEEGAHAGLDVTVVGQMQATGTPWDHAIVVPVEEVWRTHGLANGHDPNGPNPDSFGPPYDADFFPGTPAIVVQASSLAGAYGVQSQFDQRSDTMAIFPGTVLSQLHATMGDIRGYMSLITTVTQVLVAASVLIGLLILTRLFARQMAMLRAFGAPRRFVAAVLWLYGIALISIGILLGLALGLIAAQVLSSVIAARTNIAISTSIGWTELHLALAFLAITSILALIPALCVARKPVLEAIRGA